MIRNVLFRIAIVLYCIIGFPLWLAHILISWVLSAVLFIGLILPVWIFFGKIGIDTLCKYIDLDTYREMVGFEKENDAHITPLWFFYIFDILINKYKYGNNCFLK